MRKYSCWVALVMAAALVACGPATTQNSDAERDARTTSGIDSWPLSDFDFEELDRYLAATAESESDTGLQYKCYGVETEPNELFIVPCRRSIPVPRSPDELGDSEMVIRPDWPWDQAMVVEHDWPYDWAMVSGHYQATVIEQEQPRSRAIIAVVRPKTDEPEAPE